MFHLEDGFLDCDAEPFAFEALMPDRFMNCSFHEVDFITGDFLLVMYTQWLSMPGLQLFEAFRRISTTPDLYRTIGITCNDVDIFAHRSYYTSIYSAPASFAVQASSSL